jgi:hypothetical protein
MKGTDVTEDQYNAARGFAAKVGFGAKEDRLMQKSVVGTPVHLASQKVFSSPLDKGIENAVNVLIAASVETFESCEGGNGHAYSEPTIRFHGERGEGFRALGVALQHGLKVTALRRTWPVNDGEPTGPWWEMVLLLPPKTR